jgi:hypothetical protein
LWPSVEEEGSPLLLHLASEPLLLGEVEPTNADRLAR